MSEKQTRSSRHLQPTPNKKLNGWLNILIGVVVVLIAITTIFIFKWQDNIEDTAKEDTEITEPEEKVEDPVKEGIVTDEEEPPAEEEQPEQEIEQEKAVESSSDDPIVDRVITDENWQPTPTTQTGEHVSSYDDQSVDWAEKVATITAVTGIEKDNMIIWRLKNNGGANKSIATVSTNDKTEMYRVSMEWVDNEGWKPVKLEQLNTLEGAY
ncbi:YrrS family protein [Lysinibacillus sp. NPDC097287]|uniref:YrrS family protein n=1 Tax=Lysinibacillus sp. NPDC097287 TaxID=3364144 RepID=UPI003805B6C5